MLFLDFELQPEKSKLFRWLFLKCLSVFYSILINFWLFLYHIGVKTGYTSSKQVVSVGNITTGGTGKTPMIAWLLGYLDGKKLNPGVLTRGYKANRTKEVQILDSSTSQSTEKSQFGDEPWLLHMRYPHLPIYIGSNRAVSARLAEKRVDLLLLDDGMQHLKVNRDINIVLIDSLSGTGNGQIFPLGPLREPLKSMKRADIVVYTRTNLKSPDTIKPKLQPFLLPGTPQFDSEFKVEKIVSAKNGEAFNPEMVADKKCLLFSGIGNPKSFEKTVQQLGGMVVDHLILEDHHDYSDISLIKLEQLIAQSSFDLLICTEKDWVKIEEYNNRLPEFYYLKMVMTIDPLFAETVSGLLGH